VDRNLSKLIAQALSKNKFAWEIPTEKEIVKKEEFNKEIAK
jgi:hypothetical protein